MDTANPIKISCAVTYACRKNNVGLSASSARIIETGGKIQVCTPSTRTKISHNTNPRPASAIAEPHALPNARTRTPNVLSDLVPPTGSLSCEISCASCRTLEAI